MSNSLNVIFRVVCGGTPCIDKPSQQIIHKKATALRKNIAILMLANLKYFQIGAKKNFMKFAITDV